LLGSTGVTTSRKLGGHEKEGLVVKKGGIGHSLLPGKNRGVKLGLYHWETMGGLVFVEEKTG